MMRKSKDLLAIFVEIFCLKGYNKLKDIVANVKFQVRGDRKCQLHFSL